MTNWIDNQHHRLVQITIVAAPRVHLHHRAQMTTAVQHVVRQLLVRIMRTATMKAIEENPIQGVDHHARPRDHPAFDFQNRLKVMLKCIHNL